MRDIDDVTALRDCLGQALAVSDWLEVTQERIAQFAEATGDMQWIHLDEKRARIESPFGTTIAHGFLILSLISTLFRGAVSFRGIRMSVNYGLNRVRFVSPVPSGTRIRGRFSPAAVDDLSGSVQVTWQVTIEREGASRPSCVAEWVVRYHPQPPGA